MTNLNDTASSGRLTSADFDRQRERSVHADLLDQVAASEHERDTVRRILHEHRAPDWSRHTEPADPGDADRPPMRRRDLLALLLMALASGAVLWWLAGLAL